LRRTAEPSITKAGVAKRREVMPGIIRALGVGCQWAYLLRRGKK
jgi:hypothetical protein